MGVSFSVLMNTQCNWLFTGHLWVSRSAYW